MKRNGECEIFRLKSTSPRFFVRAQCTIRFFSGAETRPQLLNLPRHGDHRVATSIPFALRGYRYYQRARLVNVAQMAEYRLNGIRGQVFVDGVEHPDAKSGKLKAEYPLDTWFDIYDYGIGDEVVWLLAAAVTRKYR